MLQLLATYHGFVSWLSTGNDGEIGDAPSQNVLRVHYVAGPRGSYGKGTEDVRCRIPAAALAARISGAHRVAKTACAQALAGGPEQGRDGPVVSYGWPLDV